MLKFYWNGIKENGGKLQGCHYSFGHVLNHAPETITIYGKHYRGFSAAVHAAFTVNDDSDIQTDYICNVHIRVEPTHPLYAAVLEAYKAQEAHHAVQARKRAARCLEARA